MYLAGEECQQIKSLVSFNDTELNCCPKTPSNQCNVSESAAIKTDVNLLYCHLVSVILGVPSPKITFYIPQ